MTKDDDLAGLDPMDPDHEDYEDSYWEYVDAVIELREERRMCQRYFVPEDDYVDD